MISYAQNREDVVLARLVDRIPLGRFVDVGSGHPVLENVTYALYLAGWRGVNIEPMEREVALTRELRPDDETIQVAVGAAAGRVTLFEAPLENRGATTSNETIVERYRAEGQEFGSFEIDVVTLASIMAGLPKGEVHVLKIDVEGMEAEVIAGADLASMRPWVLVIEATVPNTKDDSAADWEAEVLRSGYVLSLFDGLNRFYVRDDLAEIRELLSVPANVFDHWVPRELEECRSALEDAERYARKVEERRRVATAFAETLQKDRDIAVAYAETLDNERERNAPHIARLHARAAEADQLELRLDELQRSLDHANRELEKLQEPRAR